MKNIKSIILLVGLIIASGMLFAQDAGDDCSLIIDFGKEDTTPWVIWSWASSDFPITDNPAGEWPQQKVRTWQKGGGWSGFGTNNEENFIETEGYDSIAVWMYSQKDSLKSLRIEVKHIVGDDEQLAEFQYINELNIPKETWKLVKFPIADIFELADFTSFNAFLFQPDGTNDTNRWIKNYYSVGSVYLERNGACPATSNTTSKEAVKGHANLFYVSKRTVHLVQKELKSFELYNMSGSLVRSFGHPKENTISLHDLRNGLYLVKAIDKNNNVSIQKTLLQ